MNEEEKKAIEFIQEIIDFLGDDDFTIYTIDKNKLLTILGLIEKQQNKIQALEKQHDYDMQRIDEVKGNAVKWANELEQIKERYEDLNWYFENQKDNFIHKDKIKEIYNILGEYRHFSTPTNEQIEQNENAVDKAVNFIKGLLEEV